MKNFKEIDGNKESSVDSTEKFNKQILQIPEEYEDDFDEKLDSIDNKEKLGKQTLQIAEDDIFDRYNIVRNFQFEKVIKIK